MKKSLFAMLLVAALALTGCSFFGEEPAPQPPAPAPQMVSYLVYRADATGSEKLVPEEITIEANDKSLAENALRSLIYTAPASAGMARVCPPEVELLDFRVDENGTAYVNFSKEIVKRSQGSYNEIMLTGAIVNTLTEFPNIHRVQLLVEGEKVITLYGHLDVEDPLERNETLLKK